MNVKRAVATAAGVMGALLLAAVVGLGHFAAHSSSGTAAQVRTAAAATAGSNAAPVRATLDVQIYGDSTNVPASTTTSRGSSDDSSYTSTYGDTGSADTAIYGDSRDGSGTTTTIYGDGTAGSTGSASSSSSTIYGDGSSSSSSGIYGDGSSGVTNAIYGD